MSTTSELINEITDARDIIRSKMVAAGQATSSDQLSDLAEKLLIANTYQTGFTPVGTVISLMGKTAPQNYLACDGTVYNIADYPELANYFAEQFESASFFGGDGTTTFAVPDLRGEFLRGTGTNSHADQGNGADVGKHQDGTIFPAIGIGEDGRIVHRGVAGTSSISWGMRRDAYSMEPQDIQYRLLSDGTDKVEAASFYSPGYTSRPTNTSILYCIASKNIYIDARFDYSLEEKVVGTWIDGKPVYQKTATGVTYIDNTAKICRADIDFGNDVLTVISAEVFDNTSRSTILFPGSNVSGMLRSYYYDINIHKLVVFYITEDSSRSNLTITATIRYTKTTD